MTWSTWRGVLGGGLATLLLVAPAAATWAEIPAPSQPGVAIPAAKNLATATKAKPKVVREAAKHEPAHPAKKLAAAKPKPPVKHLVAATKKPEPAKKIEAAKKAEPAKVAAATAKPAPPSYTITTVRGGVTQTTTRIVPLTATPALAAAPAPPAQTKVVAAAPVTQIASVAPSTPVEAKPAEIKRAVASAQPKAAVTPVSLSQPTAPARPASFAAVAATSLAALPEKPLAPASTQVTLPADPKTAAGFVSSFLSEAFRIAKSDGTSLQRRARLAELFAGKMDMKRIAGYTTADELSGASSDIQQRFRTILVSYLVETYYPQLELASDPSVKVDTAPVGPLPDGTAVVWTTFTKDGWGSQSVKWHLVNEDGHYRIVDIFSAGASLVQMERDTFVSVMRDGGLNELMAKLDARTKELASAATE
ncbi:MAG: ABC transporter substrate-binding protein [Stellaceae bacterium]